MTDRIHYSNVAAPVFLVAAVTAVDPVVTITVSAEPFGVPTAPAGWPATFPCFAVLDPGTADEEVVKVTDIAGTTMTLERPTGGGPFWFGSENRSHKAGARIEHHYTAYDANETNLHVVSSLGVHGLGGSEPVVGTTSVQTLTNKTLTAPTITNPTLTGADIAARRVTIQPTAAAVVPFTVMGHAAQSAPLVQIAAATGPVRVEVDRDGTLILSPPATEPAALIRADPSTGTTAAQMVAVADGSGNDRLHVSSAGSVLVSPHSGSTDPVFQVYSQLAWNANVLEYQKHNGTTNVKRVELKADACIKLTPSLPRVAAGSGDINVTHDSAADNTAFLRFDRFNGTSTVNVFAVDSLGALTCSNYDITDWAALPLSGGVSVYDSDTPQYRRVRHKGAEYIELRGKALRVGGFAMGGAPVGTLPAGFRPGPQWATHSCASDAAVTQNVRVDIGNGGGVVAFALGSNTFTWVSLYGVRFYTA